MNIAKLNTKDHFSNTKPAVVTVVEPMYWRVGYRPASAFPLQHFFEVEHPDLDWDDYEFTRSYWASVAQGYVFVFARVK